MKRLGISVSHQSVFNVHLLKNIFGFLKTFVVDHNLPPHQYSSFLCCTFDLRHASSNNPNLLASSQQSTLFSNWHETLGSLSLLSVNFCKHRTNVHCTAVHFILHSTPLHFGASEQYSKSSRENRLVITTTFRWKVYCLLPEWMPENLVANHAILFSSHPVLFQRIYGDLGSLQSCCRGCPRVSYSPVFPFFGMGKFETNLWSRSILDYARCP